MHLGPFKDLVRDRCGLSFEDTREAILAEGVKARMSARRFTAPDEYYTVLSRDQDEFGSLINLITINETYFFREAAQFRVLTEKLIPEIAGEADGGRKIRILSAGCSTGEEPYTIAMSLMEKFGPAFEAGFSVLGFDIDEAALKAARAGVYSQHSFRGVPERIRQRYFERDGRRYRIRDNLRKGVEFLHLNILGDSWPEAVQHADVIFYRNVSIYFSPDAQQRILENLAGLLGDRGYLFLSSTETLHHDIGVMSLVEKEGLFLYSKGFNVRFEERRRRREERKDTVRSVPPAAALPPEEKAAGNLPKPRAGGGARKAFDEALLCAEENKYEEALGLLENAAALDPSFLEVFLLQAGILINLERLDEAETACRRALETDRWSFEGCVLLGMIEKIRGNFEAAKKKLKEALYVQSSCWIAHFYLGEIFRLEGDEGCARREFEIVLTQMAREEDAGRELAFFSLAFSADQVRRLCRHNLALTT